ncbi:hypothetical protein TGME49_328800, partial [Toxoplasma gondii ME49]
MIHRHIRSDWHFSQVNRTSTTSKNRLTLPLHHHQDSVLYFQSPSAFGPDVRRLSRRQDLHRYLQSTPSAPFSGFIRRTSQTCARGFLSVRAGQYSSSGKDSILVVTPLFKTLAHSLVVTRGLLCRGRNKLCVTYLVREVAAGWEFKTLHATTASFVFVCIFVHVSRIPNTAIQRM